MFKGKNKPHLYTWISIFLVTAVVAYIQFDNGAGIGAIPTILGVIVDAIILFYCFRFGTKDVVLVDKFCLAFSITGVITYALLHKHPIISLAIVTGAKIISFLPTFRKTRNDPYSESLPSYYLLFLKLALILVALQNYNLLTTSYSIVWGIIITWFILATYHWRANDSKKHPYKDESIAPLI